MGLFDGYKRQSYALNDELDPRHATVIILLKSVYADEWETRAELLVLRQIMSKSPIFSDSDDASDQMIIKRCQSFLASNPNALRLACEALPDDMRNAVFSMVIEIVFADGVVDPKEVDFAEEVQKALNISPEFARACVDVFGAMYGAEMERAA